MVEITITYRNEAFSIEFGMFYQYLLDRYFTSLAPKRPASLTHMIRISVEIPLSRMNLVHNVRIRNVQLVYPRSHIDKQKAMLLVHVVLVFEPPTHRIVAGEVA